MIKAAVIDDEMMARETITEMINLYCPDVEIVGQAENVKNGVSLIQTTRPDVLLLDIQLTDGTGFDILKQLNHFTYKVIFITAYEDYALKAIKFSALDYVLKPVDPNDLIAAVEKAKESVEEKNNSVKLQALLNNINSLPNGMKKIVLKTANNVHLINLNDIIRCQSDKNYTHFHIRDHEVVVVSKTLKEFDDILSDLKFFRVHQSHLINMIHVKRYEKSDGGYVVMSDGSIVPVSFRKKDELMKQFNSF
jgi:two-component system LytT family response regulator